MAHLKAVHLSKKFGEHQVLKDISLEVGEHELVSLLGVSGSGKTTLFNLISGLLPPDEGRIFLDGEEITGTPGKISYMLQKDLLLPYRTIEDNVALPLILKGEKKKAAREKVRPYFAPFGLAGTEKNIPASFPEVCAREPHFSERTCSPRDWLFSTNHFPPWTPSPRAVCTAGT